MINKNWKKRKSSNKVEMPKQNEEINYKEDSVDEDEESDVPRWYDQFPDDNSITVEKVSEEELASLRIEAQHILDDETKKFNSKQASAGKGSNRAWINTVLKNGTAKDKLAANVITIQNSPLHSLSNLSSLINAVNPAKKKECFIVMETLAELFIEDLLRPGRKLRSFDKQPLAKLNELSGGCVKGRRNRLAVWLFEDKLKDLYASFVNNINIVAKDTVDNNRIKAVSVLYKLLSSHPEQEQALLENLINKHGDPQQKVVSKVIYCITQLLRIHPNMKQIVMNEIEKVLFRPNISSRTQYYCICSLSQFIFSIHDTEIARNIITIYFSFFKALIKKGEIDSRLMGALLMGVKRAHPYAKLNSNAMMEHIDTLYKLVHLTPFNIALHALTLLQEISNDSNDRFYSALYKKLLDSQLNSSSHHAMFINLMFKALSKDSNITRVKAFIKRLLQVCLYSSTPLICALLYMLSQLISRRKLSLFADAMEAQNDAFAAFNSNEDDDEEEKYIDVDKEEEKLQEEISEEVKETVIKEEDEDGMEKKPLRGWIHCEMNQHSFAPRSEVYDPLARNPAYSRADKTAYLELLYLSKHFHPTVSLFAEKILRQELITYTGDPLVDFTTAKFLERFVFKNPKVKMNDEDKGPERQLAQRKYYRPSGIKSLQVTSSDYLKNDIQDIPVDELFLYKYLKIKYKDGHPDDRRKDLDDEADDDNASVTSEEFVEMINNMYGGGKQSKQDLDFMDELEHGLKKSKQKDKSKTDDDSGDEDEDEEEEEEEDEDEDEDLEDVDDDDDEVIDFGEDVEDFDGELDFDEILRDKKSKVRSTTAPAKKSKSKKGDDLESLFAPAEEFAEILEDAGSSKHKPGMAESLATNDNAAVKQLDWEKNRDRWVRNFNGNNKRKHKNKNPKKFKKRRT
ncbi:hypothetical protein O3M35_004769 [Rhynocoris fuscipes]|uniref:CCAAT/enhancer-binding protein zeta n=1 Tax=Rhynocoris fuscipes TaxID=488301 RepID=A0AAW1DFQ0_9HEMI